MKSRIFQDQWEADIAAHEWLKSIAPKDRPHEIERFDVHLFHGHIVDGLLGCLWVGGILIAQVSVVRNDANWSVLTCVDLRENAEGTDEH